ncbi:MAG: hypothetical protein ACREP9_20795, partial [Candidatus Dormibacteraceae bacterium]
EQGESTESISNEARPNLPDGPDEVPVADAIEQSMAVREVQVLRPKGSREEVPEADWIEQSVEVPLDDDEIDR